MSVYPKILVTVTAAEYATLVSGGKISADKLYWISDTHKIFKGTVDYSAYIEAVSSLPVSAIPVGKLFLNTTDGKVSFYDGTNWHVVSLPTVTTMFDTSDPTQEDVDDNHVPTTEAVSEFVHDLIGGSADVVKSITASSTAGVITYQTADGTDHDVTVPGVFKAIADKEVSGEAVAGTFTLTDTDGNGTDYLVKKVMASITAGSADGKVAVTMTSGSHAEVTVPGVFTSVAWDATARTLTFTDSDGVSTGEDHVVNLGKDIFIDKDAPNRYENGNLYLYLNDGTNTGSGTAATTTDTEIVIPVTALITDYFGGDTNSIQVDIDGTTHEVTASVVLRQDVAESSVGAGDGFTNALKLSSSTAATGGIGLYVDNSEIEDNIDALADAITWGTFATENA